MMHEHEYDGPYLEQAISIREAHELARIEAANNLARDREQEAEELSQAEWCRLRSAEIEADCRRQGMDERETRQQLAQDARFQQFRATRVPVADLSSWYGMDAAGCGLVYWSDGPGTGLYIERIATGWLLDLGNGSWTVGPDELEELEGQLFAFWLAEYPEGMNGASSTYNPGPCRCLSVHHQTAGWPNHTVGQSVTHRNSQGFCPDCAGRCIPIPTRRVGGVVFAEGTSHPLDN